MWVEKLFFFVVFFKSLLGTTVVIYVPELNYTNFVGASVKGNASLPLLFKLHEIWSVDSQENN